MIAALALLMSLTASSSSSLPSRPTSADALSTKELAHHDVLRIDRDFGMAQWEIALDGWVARDDPTQVADVRLWWLNTDKGDRRKPFSRHLRRFIEFGYTRNDDGQLRVRLAGDNKAYAFVVSIEDGAAVVRADVHEDDGGKVAGCRCQSGRLIARRVLGIPVGIEALRVQCTDAGGASHEGEVPFKAVDGGPVYEAAK